MADTSTLPSDRALVAAARAGSDEAWEELRSRHLGAVGALADVTDRKGGDVSVTAAFDRLRTGLLDEATPTTDDGGPAIRAVRPMAIAALTDGAFGPTPLDERSSGTAAAADLELRHLAAAFAQLPEAWQTVLWHRLVEHAPAVELTALLGRSAAEVIALEQTADRGLFDAYNAVALDASPPPSPTCRPVIALLGGYRRGTLPATQRRLVESHLDNQADREGCTECRDRLRVADRFGTLLPAAIVPGLTGLDVDRYRVAIGAAGAAIGVAALSAKRSERTSRLAQTGAVMAVAVALLAAAFVIRAPFGDLQAELADLIERVTPTTTTAPPVTSPPVDTTDPDVPVDPLLPSRVELVFPGAAQGAVYVPGGRPLNLSLALSTPAPVFAGGSGTVDVALTNNDTQGVSVRYLVRTSSAFAFEELSEGAGACRSEDDNGATCSVTIDAGASVSMALRFDVEPGGPDRLVIDPSIPSPSLEVPVVTVPDLLVGRVTRGDLAAGGNTFGSCRPSADCADGRRDASSASVEFDEDSEIERALLVWEGDDAAAWSRSLGVIGPTDVEARTVESTSGEAAAAATATGSFTSTADVTDLVRESGAGRYTVVRPPSAEELGDGSWTIVVITKSPTVPRRLFVVTRPALPVTPDAPMDVDIPVAGSRAPDAGAPDAGAPIRPAVVSAHARVGALALAGTQVWTIDNVAVGGDDPFGQRSGEPGTPSTPSYDLEIASTEDALSIFVSTTAGSVRLAAVALALDIVS